MTWILADNSLISQAVGRACC